MATKTPNMGTGPPAGPAPQVGPPPPGGDRDRSNDIVVSQFVLMSIATIIVCLRLRVRLKMTRKIGWDDILITLALIVTIIGLAFNCKMVQEGFGRHLYYLKQTPKVIPRATFWHIIWQPTFFISVTLTRVSICLLLIRIFGVNRTWRLCLWGVTGLIVAIAVPSFVMLFTQCRPYAKSWDPLGTPGYCWPADNNVKVALYSGIMAVLQDWLLATIPIALLWNLKISLQKKTRICTLMGLGYFSGVCAIDRTVISMKVFKAGGLADSSSVIIDLRIWGTVENLTGIIAASTPALKPLYTKRLGSHYFPWSKLSSTKGYVNHSDEIPVQRQNLQNNKDPYPTPPTAAKSRSYGNSGAYGSSNDKSGDQIMGRTDIELDEYHDQRPIIRKAEPAYHGV
ncbi:MAG: hypothetical protein Q9222_003042 [Ikaeria aurantiellina]